MSRLVFDIGGTHLRMAVVSEGVMGAVEKVDTPQEPNEAIALLTSSHESVSECVGGVAGIIENGTIIDSPNLPSWNGFPFERTLSERIGAAVRVCNDAAIAAYGEAVAGSGVPYARVAYLTIGTGVGGALIINKTLPSPGEVYEPGRMGIEEGRTLEGLVGGAALRAEFGAAPEALPRSVFDERTRYVAIGISALIDEWAPDVVVLNGALMNDETAFRIGEIEEALGELRGDQAVPVVRADLGDMSGLIGASIL